MVIAISAISQRANPIVTTRSSSLDARPGLTLSAILLSYTASVRCGRSSCRANVRDDKSLRW